MIACAVEKIFYKKTEKVIKTLSVWLNVFLKKIDNKAKICYNNSIFSLMNFFGKYGKHRTI
jgi:hypothetical protein